jgi:hypothetical protein
LPRLFFSLLQTPALVAAASGLFLATLACQIRVGGPSPPGGPIPISAQAASDFESAWRSAVATAALTRKVMLVLTEEQVTSYLAQRLQSDPKPILSQPQVYLRHGQILIYGVTRRYSLEASILVSVSPILTQDGDRALEIGSADLGPLPAPEGLKETMSALLTEAFTGAFGPLATGIRLTSVAIVDGQIAIVGTLR